jgi:ADP-ribosyl-[dinitrogen reductase] hydrolase
MLWFHLPIVDVSTPDEHFEQAWDVAGEELRSILRGGSNVLVHCRGGLGRAGTIAARLLVELGMDPATASISQQVLPRSRPSHAVQGRKPIRRGRSQ